MKKFSIKLVRGPWADKKRKGRNYCVVSYGDKEESTTYARYLLEKKLKRRLAYDEVIDYIDKDTTNDDITNLRILTSKTGGSLGSSVPKQVKPAGLLTDEQVIRLRLTPNLDVKKACEEYRIAPSTLRKLLSGVTYTHLPYYKEKKPVGRPRKLTDAQVVEIRKNGAKKMAEKHGISQSLAYDIKRGNAYSQVSTKTRKSKCS